MRSLLLAAFLFIISTFSVGATDDQDDILRFKVDEIAGILMNIRQAEADQQTARVIFARMQNHINELEAEIRGAKCL